MFAALDGAGDEEEGDDGDETRGDDDDDHGEDRDGDGFVDGVGVREARIGEGEGVVVWFEGGKAPADNEGDTKELMC